MIVVLHGALGSAHQFTPLLGAIDKPYSMFEFPGHGTKPDIQGAWSIESCMQALQVHLESLGGSARIFGYSMGGYVAMTLALKRPDLVARIVTLGTKLAWSESSAAHEVAKLDADTIERKVPAFAADLRRRHGDEHWRVVLTKTAALMHSLGRAPLLTDETVATLTVPVRLCVGDRDEMVSHAETFALHRAMPNSEFAVLPGTRHAIERVPPAEILHHIHTWLADS